MNEITTRQSTELMTDDDVWGAAESLDSSDLQLPYLHIAQATSKNLDNATGILPGVIVESSENKPLAQVVPIVIFDLKKSIVVRDEKSGKWVSEEPLTIQNASLPYNDVRNGVAVTNTHKVTYLVYIIGNPELPYQLGIASSNKATRGVNNFLKGQILRLQKIKQPSAAVAFELSTRLEASDKGNYWVPVVTMGRATTPEEIAVAKKWFEVTKGAKPQLVQEEHEPQIEIIEPVQPVQQQPASKWVANY